MEGTYVVNDYTPGAETLDVSVAAIDFGLERLYVSGSGTMFLCIIGSGPRFIELLDLDGKNFVDVVLGDLDGLETVTTAISFYF